MRFTLVDTKHVQELWDYFTNNEEPVIRHQYQRVRAAAGGTASRMFIRYVPPGQNYNRVAETDHLMSVGTHFAASAWEFSQMFHDEPTNLTYATSNDNALYVIPFRTASPDERRFDSVVVLYGRDLQFMAFKFQQLSDMGWTDEFKRTLE